MYVERFGDGGTKILALHGWAGTHRDFLPLARHIPSHVQLIAPDLPGHGCTTPPDAWTEDALLKELQEFTQFEEIRVVVGFCSGAVLALLLAERLPQQLRRIVMIDPFAFVPWYFRLFLKKHIGVWAYRFTFEMAPGRSFTNTILRTKQRADEDFTAAFQNIRRDVALNWLAFLGRVGTPARFSALPVEVDIIYGERTFRAVRDSVGEYIKVFPHARVVCLSKIGHLPLVRAARSIANIIASTG